MAETKKCEYCGRQINFRIKFCPFCGGEVQDLFEGELSPVCPCCGVPLEIQAHNGEEYLLCSRCGGLWVDRDTFHQVTKESDVYKKENVEGRYFRGPLMDPVKYLPCVRCGKLMNRKNFARISGVIIDECRSLGVWLDTGELEKIRLFIVDGGLEKAQDKQIEKTAMEIKELAKKVDQTAFLQKLLHFWNLKRILFGD